MHLMAKEWQGSSLFLAAVCPGLVQTEASRPFFDPESFANAPTPNQAAEPFVDLAVTANDSRKSFYGQLVQAQKMQVIRWK